MNQQNGKRYIGSTVNLNKRWRDHASHLRRGRHHNAHLQTAFDKYGEEAFVFSILECVVPESLIEREQHYLDMRHPEYNLLPTAGSRLGCRLSAETKCKIGDANRNPSAETRRKIGKVHKGKHVSTATRHKLSESHKGKHHSHSPETKHKISKALTGRHFTDQHCTNISIAAKARWRRVHAAKERID